MDTLLTPSSLRFLALKTGPNADFNSFMDCIIDYIQLGIGFNKDIATEELIIATHTKYNNMVEDKSWGHVDPSDAKILALTTNLKTLEKDGGPKPNAAAYSTDRSNPVGSGKKFNPLEEWRKKFDGDIKEVNGHTSWWCKHHKTKGYDGLYVSLHSPVNHKAWSKDKRTITGSIAPPLQSPLMSPRNLSKRNPSLLLVL